MSNDNDLMTLKTKVSEPAELEVGSSESAENQTPSQTQPPREDSVPLMGIFAVGFALLSIFSFAPLFLPLGLLFGIIALFLGQVLLGVSAIGLSIIGGLTSPTILTIISFGAFLSWLGL